MNRIFNAMSVITGIGITFVLCLIYAAIVQTTDPMILWGGILAIIFFVFVPGLKTVDIEHIGVLKIFGARWPIWFKEGTCWIPWFIASIEIVNCQLDVVDVPLIKIFTKNNVEVGVDIWVYLKVEDPFIYLNLKNPEAIIKTSTISKTNEAAAEFVNDHTDKQCRDCPNVLQQKIWEKIIQEKKDLGIGVSDIDIRPILPTDEFKQIYTVDFKKNINTKRYVKDAKRIAEATPGLTPSEIANTTEVVEGIAKKEIKEEKKTFKLDVEPEILKFVAEFLPKKKAGGKK